MWQCEKCRGVKLIQEVASECCKVYEFKYKGELEQLYDLTEWIVKEHEGYTIQKEDYIGRPCVVYKKDWVCAVGSRFIDWTIRNHKDKWTNQINKNILDQIGDSK